MVEIATVNYELIKNYNNTEDVAYNFFSDHLPGKG